MRATSSSASLVASGRSIGRTSVMVVVVIGSAFVGLAGGASCCRLLLPGGADAGLVGVGQLQQCWPSSRRRRRDRA